MSATARNIQIIRDNIGTYPDFPKPGILFRDVFGVLANPTAAKALHDVMREHCARFKGHLHAVCALESRGFLFGPQIALALEVPFVPIRKPGKLPGEVTKVLYHLEYGQDAFEIQKRPTLSDSKVVIVDDLLATGGSLAAACELVHSLGGQVLECLVVMELEDLNGRSKVPAEVHSIVKY